jgi:DNA repair photolyase
MAGARWPPNSLSCRPLPTELIREKAKTALSWNDSPDIGFDRALNPYRGCEHGCDLLLCPPRPCLCRHVALASISRPRLMFKPNLPELLEKELSTPRLPSRSRSRSARTPIPYQPDRADPRHHPPRAGGAGALRPPGDDRDKGLGVLRDLDILKRLAERNLVHVCLSITTLDMKLARVMEPRAANPLKRLAAVTELARAGIPVGVLAAPMIPALNDMELERILEASARAGASRAGYVLLRLPLEIKAMFEAWLTEHHPERAARILALVRETRGGRLYDARFGQRQSGTGPYAELLAQRFRIALRRYGLEGRRTGGGISEGLDCSQFQPPRVPARQLELL